MKSALLLQSDSLSSGWLLAIENLLKAKLTQTNLTVTMTQPGVSFVDNDIVMAVNTLLSAAGKASVSTVANTIFPSAMLAPTASRQELFARYQALYPRLRRAHRANTYGTYFGRMVAFPTGRTIKDESHFNQLEEVILKLKSQLSTAGPKRFCYQISIYSPMHDYRRSMGFPCLSHINASINQSSLDLFALYRSQYFFEKALGNYIGLSHLQNFIASEVGLTQGTMTVQAIHGTWDSTILNAKSLRDHSQKHQRHHNAS